MEIAILGASSQISKGLIKLYSNNEKYHLKLFVRDKLTLQAWIKSNRLTENIIVNHFDEFTIDLHIDLIISGEMHWKELDNAYKKLLTREGSPLTFILNWDNDKNKIGSYRLWQNGSLH